MKIKFVRNGFANNSSSSHSIIFSKKNIGNMRDDTDGCEGFGWNNFTCASREAKESYLLSMLIDNMCQELKSKSQFYTGSRSIGNHDWKINPIVYMNDKKVVLNFCEYKVEHYIKRVLKNDLVYFGYDKIFENFETILDGFSECFDSIDHQSAILLPRDPKTDYIHHGYAKDFCKFVLENEFVILGGNDNSCDDHEYSSYNEGHELLNFMTSIKYTKPNVVYDGKNQDYVIQDSEKGTIYRISFTNDCETKKAEFPTLVDISITSFCDKGCPFCYQSSTKSGKHADLNVVKNVLNELKNNGCLEVVFGGGEPTSHPKIAEILEHAKGLGLVVGLTTKNYNLHSHKKANEILSNINTLAISCNSMEETKNAVGCFKECYKINHKFTGYYQTILGLNSLDSLMEQFEYVKDNNDYHDDNFNLLGFKNFGFGKDQIPNDVEGWIERIKEANEWNQLNIGVDSIIVKKYKDELLSNGVDYKYLVGEEGKFSCYIDCVENKISASSFTDVKFDFDSNWLQTFKSF